MSATRPPLDTHRVRDVTVTMATTAEMREEAARLMAEADAVSQAADKLRADAVGLLVEAGFMLVARAKEWAPANPAAINQLEHANEVIRSMEEEGFAVEAAGQRRGRGLGGLFRRKAPVESPEARQRREERNGQLRVILAELGRGFGGAHPAVASAHGRAVGLESQSQADIERATRMRADAAALEAEAAQREATTAEFGFDILLTAARLDRSGPAAPAKVALDLRPGERVVYTLATGLARQKSMATPERAEQGLPFPVEKTGIPYAVGRYVGQALKQEDLAKLGTGTLVVTNQRIGFAGDVKSFNFPVSSVRWATQYRDGLVLLREGRENADVLLTPSAGEALFHVNWVMQEAGPGTS